MAVGDGEVTLLRDGIARLENALRDHIADVRENRKEIRQELAKLQTELDGLQLWKAKVVGVSGFIALVSSFLFDFFKALIHR